MVKHGLSGFLPVKNVFSTCAIRMKKEVILSSAYLAPVEYYTKLFAYDTVHIEQFDHYMKQTYRNRCTIASAGGSLSLTIPTEKVMI